ncbi:MAG TPA: chromate transporter, partial [Actinomycetota bacterium]|nr:chromate transporter [Actinomycetota bacterium]
AEVPAAASDHAERVGSPPPGPGRAVRVLAAGLLAWWGPLALVIGLRGADDVLAREALFFSQAALVTFGGAYAVLAYVDRAAVSGFGWLAPGEMVTGLGLAETTPGPLIIVAEFVGFLAAYRDPGGLPPAVAGALGAAVTVWATFAPSFLLILLGAPFVERLRGNRRLTGALSAVTAAVVGVIANLAVAFAARTLFGRTVVVRPFGADVALPVPGSLEPFPAAVALVAFLGMWRRRWNVVPVVLASGAAGWLWSVLR